MGVFFCKVFPFMLLQQKGEKDMGGRKEAVRDG